MIDLMKNVRVLPIVIRESLIAYSILKDFKKNLQTQYISFYKEFHRKSRKYQRSAMLLLRILSYHTLISNQRIFFDISLKNQNCLNIISRTCTLQDIRSQKYVNPFNLLKGMGQKRNIVPFHSCIIIYEGANLCVTPAAA